MPRKKTSISDEPEIERTAPPRGRPPNAAKSINMDTVEAAAPLRRNAPRVAREAPRETAREPAREGAVMVTGRDGEVLTRRRAQVGDEFFVPPNEIPKGWTYQWNTFAITGQEAVETQLQMHANGWRPVPATRHPGRWTAAGHKGAIIVKGLRLEERPIELTREAQAEDMTVARNQMRDQNEALKLTKKLPDGMAVGGKYRGTGADVRMQIDPGLDIPRPDHQFEE